MKPQPEAVIGVWDGHDAGAALVVGGRVVLALNEERLSGRKLDVGMPLRCLEIMRKEAAGLRVAWAPTTSDFAKTLTRWCPWMKEDYYKLRRRLVYPGRLQFLKEGAKYRLTQLPTNDWLRAHARRYFASALGVAKEDVFLVDHHAAHAGIAAYWPDWRRDSVIVTLDGIGDGESGSVWKWSEGEASLKKLSSIPGSASLGLFFEHITNELQMRPLEDEGKVMALATYAAEQAPESNLFLKWFTLERGPGGMPELRCLVKPGAMGAEVRRIIWSTPREAVCKMAQQTIEHLVPRLFSMLAEATGCGVFGYAGGVASNIKVNRLIRHAPGVELIRVCPAMGDGGLALGAALFAWKELSGARPLAFEDFKLGTQWPDLGVEAERWDKETGARLQRPANMPALVAECVAKGEIVMWAQGRMEMGPRALGARSIVARADSIEARDDLNLRLKRRVWFQPFCPSILLSEAGRLLSDYRPGVDDNSHMTMGFLTSAEGRRLLAGAIGPDGSCRPQMVADSASDPWARMLGEVRRLTGVGAVINTSLNMHGKPMSDAAPGIVEAWRESGVQHLALGSALLSKQNMG